MRIVFWGTPEFAVPSLRALLGEGHDVVAVVCQPDRPAGRGRGVRPPPVKTVATAEAIPVFQPENARDGAFVERLRSIVPDASVVVAYGQILPRIVLELPPEGSINVHASLLPELRGAAPVQWAIARGHEQTGVTIMRMDERMDAGPILLQTAEPIGPEETGSDLATRLSEIGAETLIEALALLEAGAIVATPQDEAKATYAPKIGRVDARVDWSAPAELVARRIRAFDAVPGAWTTLDGGELKVYRPALATDAGSASPGTVLDVSPADASEGVLVGCGIGAVWIREVQAPGKRRMTASEWSRGSGIATGARLS